MEAVIIMYDPMEDVKGALRIDIETTTEQQVGDIWHGEVRYRQRRIYARLAQEDILYFKLRYGNDIIHTGEEVDRIHKQMGL